MRKESLGLVALLVLGTLATLPTAAADPPTTRCRVVEGCIPTAPAVVESCTGSAVDAINCVFVQTGAPLNLAGDVVNLIQNPPEPCTDPAGCNKHGCPGTEDQNNACHHRQNP